MLPVVPRGIVVVLDFDSSESLGGQARQRKAGFQASGDDVLS